MAELQQAEQAVKAAADALVADAVAYVRQHPSYVQLVQTLGERALAAIATGL